MNKKFSILASVLLGASLLSCDSGNDDDNEVVYSRNMMVAIADQSGKTQYTPTATGFYINEDKPGVGSLALVAIQKPDGTILNMPTCSNMTVNELSDGQGYVFRAGMSTQFSNFANDIPMSVSAKLSGRIWTSSRTTNASVSMTFSNGTSLAGFGGDLSFYTNATITDSQNPTDAPVVTADESSNIVRIALNPSVSNRKANFYIYQTSFNKNDGEKMDILIEDVSFDIDAADGTITFRTAEATPYKFVNGSKSELLESYKIKDFECMLSVGFDGICDLNFTCGDRYKFSALLTESLKD